MYEELTFRKYEKLDGYKTDKKYIVYFEEYEKPFEISTISDKKLDKTSLGNLTKGESIKVYYKDTSSKNKKYDYVICEFSHDSAVLLSLSDYVETNQNNQIAGMIVCPIMVIVGLFLVGFFVKKVDSYMKLCSNSMEDLGKIKMEYVAQGNVIRIYNSANVCSLVINDKVVDQYWGAVALTFCLSGSIKIEGEKIPVEARMGYLNMRLYVDGNLVGKVFMGLG